MAGDDEAATAIFDRYVQRLLALARSRLGTSLRRRIDPEDVVQSAYRSFFLRAETGDFQLIRSGDLWRILARTTLNKLYGQVERHTAAKRSVDCEIDPAALQHLAGREPTVADLIAVSEQLALVLQELSADERSVLTSLLQGHGQEEIAESIGKSTRTVRRLAAQARERFERCLLNDDSSAGQPAIPTIRDPQGAPLSFSDYVLEKLVGSGGMGKVYRATDRRTGAVVAIKSLHKARQQDARAVSQFLQESRVLAELRHPNIVRVEGLGQFPGGGYFIVMEFVDGTDLQSRLDGGTLSPRESTALCKTVAKAAQHAHDRGIIHCDLKPGNVLVSADDRVCVSDFGFAHLLGDSAPESKLIGGTAGYIAPEVLSLASPPTPASDVFALGAMLWMLVTKRLAGRPDEVIAPEPARKPVAEVCKRCLAADPSERYASMSDVIDALSAAEILLT